MPHPSLRTYTRVTGDLIPCQPLTTRIPANIRVQLRMFCVQHERSTQDVVGAALQDYMRRHKLKAV